MTKLVCTLEHVEEEMELDLIRHRIVGAIARLRLEDYRKNSNSNLPNCDKYLDWTNDPSTCPLPTQLASHLGRHGSRAEREHDTRVVFQSMLLDVKIDGKALDQAALNLSTQWGTTRTTSSGESSLSFNASSSRGPASEKSTDEAASKSVRKSLYTRVVGEGALEDREEESGSSHEG
ncbi:hypothetical protein HZH68_013479 [Vespula germanica]|uniref:Uncharacterized protein n=1 Tax=Vespula germanica TaxID=30212 RepID=A0A834JEE5_VESGE|nr:hypothetical protein HZH68_013479 [Vespula germanica]